MSTRQLLLPFALLVTSSACAGKLTVLDELLAAQADGGAEVGDGTDDEDAGTPGDGTPGSDGTGNDPGGDGSVAGDGSGGDADPAVERGRTLYAQQCAFCHAADGSGGSVSRPLTESKPADQLASYIDANMPPGSESNCDAACAADLAAFILSEFAN